MAGRGKEEENEVDKALKEAARRKVQKLKSLELDKYLVETEKDLKRLKVGFGFQMISLKTPSLI